MPENKYISQLTFGSDVYLVKDKEAREQIADMAKFTQFLGVTTSNIVNGSTISTIVIDGEDVTAVAGDIVIKGDKEFIFNGSAWAEFGDVSIENLGDFAFVDEGSVTVKEYGNPTWEGTLTHFDFVGNSLTSTGTTTVEGTVSQPSFSGDELTATGSFTPAGTVSQPTFSGTPLNSTGTATVTGTISKPSIDVDDTTTGTVGLNAGAVATLNGTAYSVSVDESNENLSFTALTFNGGTLPSLTGTQTFVTSVTAELHESPTFTQTGGSVSVTGTPEGTVSQPTFTGTLANIEVIGTPEGTVSQPTFTQTLGTTSVSGTPTGAIKVGDELTASGNYTPNGSITQGTASDVTKTVTPVSI